MLRASSILFAKAAKQPKSTERKKDAPGEWTKKTKEEWAVEDAKRKENRVKNALKLAARKPNFWDLVFKYPDFGVGKKFRRTLWAPETHSYWTITRVAAKRLTGPNPSGKAWGILTLYGRPGQKERLIGATKRRGGWKLFDLPPLEAPLPKIEQKPEDYIEDPVLPTVYGRVPTKHPVPRGFFPDTQIRANWMKLSEREREPVPGITIDSKYSDWDQSKLPPTAEALHKQKVADFKERERQVELKIIEAIERFDLKTVEDLIRKDNADLPESVRDVL